MTSFQAIYFPTMASCVAHGGSREKGGGHRGRGTNKCTTVC